MARLDGKTSRKYVRALLELTGVEQLEQIRDALQQFVELWEDCSDLRETLPNPGIPATQKEAVIRDIAGQLLPNHSIFANFLALLQENRRIGAVADIINTLDEVIAELRQLLSLTVTSAFDVPAEEQEQLQQAAQRDFGSLASIAWQVDPELLGGLVVQAGDRLLDGSVKSSLDRIRHSLLA